MLEVKVSIGGQGQCRRSRSVSEVMVHMHVRGLKSRFRVTQSVSNFEDQMSQSMSRSQDPLSEVKIIRSNVMVTRSISHVMVH